MNDPWSNPDSYGEEDAKLFAGDRPHGFDGVRSLSGVVIASVIILVLLVYGVIRFH